MTFKHRAQLACAIAAALISCAAGSAAAEPVKNIVLVHGAFVDGSGWRPVYDILKRDGFNVTVVQQPLTGLAEDVAATRRALARQDGPTILVGHSYGGAIITEAGVDQRFPAASRDAIKKTPDGYTYLDPSRYHAEFAADLPAAEAEFEARSQFFTAAAVFATPITNPAWKLKPSWYMVAKSDRIMSPDLERMYAARAHSHTVEIEGASHSVYRSHPEAVAALIEDAATHAQDRR